MTQMMTPDERHDVGAGDQVTCPDCGLTYRTYDAAPCPDCTLPADVRDLVRVWREYGALSQGAPSTWDLALAREMAAFNALVLPRPGNVSSPAESPAS